MSATTPAEGRGLDRAGRDRRPAAEYSTRRLSTETKAAFKTTEFIAYLAVLAGILIAGAVSKASHYGGHDPFRADRVWLYATILTVGYMVSRGLAKAGARERYDDQS
jgi:hypothetical protein